MQSYRHVLHLHYIVETSLVARLPTCEPYARRARTQKYVNRTSSQKRRAHVPRRMSIPAMMNRLSKTQVTQVMTRNILQTNILFFKYNYSFSHGFTLSRFCKLEKR